MISTYYLGQRQGFNDQLNDTTTRFTYFAPRDYAWNVAAVSYPSTSKKIFMPEFSYHTKQILERHLVIADEAYTMAKLKEMKHNDTIVLPAARDSLKLRVREYSEKTPCKFNTVQKIHITKYSISTHFFKRYQIEWEGNWIRVFRPDVECTNGIIHVIDAVLLKDSDVRVTGAASVTSLASHLIIILVAKLKETGEMGLEVKIIVLTAINDHLCQCTVSQSRLFPGFRGIELQPRYPKPEEKNPKANDTSQFHSTISKSLARCVERDILTRKEKIWPKNVFFSIVDYAYALLRLTC
ncbi:hypothetical protein E2986_08590 [Frieseomelitta varia]|uniref:FAS1 domain-containing protein n=1 Tax=Frieseomelitta varia TaxID=561572 RepID=A0A833VQK2_9HYME|nr:hypothetical protein E2986_08590 [Frieseomelitta varia]